MAQQIINMTRNELKQMWFNLPTSNTITKTVLVETKYNHVTVTNDTPSGFSEFKTNPDSDALQYALNTKEYKSGEYQLVIKQI